MIQILPGFLHRPDSESIPSFPPLSGGIRISVNGNVITTVTNGSDNRETKHPTVYTSEGEEFSYPTTEFAGEDIGLSLNSIYSAFEPFLVSSAERHKEYVAELFGEPGVVLIVLSHLDGTQLRLAALPRQLDQQIQPSPESMIGYPTNPSEFANALADCFEDCIEYTKRAYVETERWADFTDEFDEFHNTYYEYVRSLRAVDEE